MRKIIDTVLKVVLSLIILIPIVGAFNVFPEPTPELYNTPQAYEFIQVLTAGKYIVVINAIVFAIALVSIWANRMALAALLILPITINIVAFHLFLDGGLFTGGAVVGDVLLALNLYFLWQQRMRYLPLLHK